jgi:hypothetical protein
MVVCKCFKLVKGIPKCAFVRLYFRKKKKKISYGVSIIQIHIRDDYTCLIMLTYTLPEKA